MAMGRNEAKAVMTMTVWFPIPDQMTTMGVHAMAGIGSSTERSGTKKDSQKAKRPIRMPTMVPTIAAMKKEKGSRQAVLSVCSRIGLSRSFQSWSPIPRLGLSAIARNIGPVTSSHAL